MSSQQNFPQDEFYDRKLEKMLPYPEQLVGAAWSDLKVTTEAEKWCKPFICPVQRCQSRASKDPEDRAKCDIAWRRMERCIDDVTKHISQLRESKR